MISFIPTVRKIKAIIMPYIVLAIFLASRPLVPSNHEIIEPLWCNRASLWCFGVVWGQYTVC